MEKVNYVQLVPLVSRAPITIISKETVPQWRLPAFNKTVLHYALRTLSKPIISKPFLFVFDGDKSEASEITRILENSKIRSYKLEHINGFTHNWLERLLKKQARQDENLESIHKLNDIFHFLKVPASQSSSPIELDKYVGFLLSGLQEPLNAFPKPTIDQPHQEAVNKSPADNEIATAFSLLQTTAVDATFDASTMKNAAEILLKSGRQHDAECLFSIALVKARRDLKTSHEIALSLAVSQKHEMALSAYRSIISEFEHDGTARFLAAKSLIRLNRTHQIGAILGRCTFSDLASGHFNHLGFLASRFAGDLKGKDILEQNWIRRPDAHILHAKLKNMASAGSGIARLREVQQADERGIPIHSVDRLHAASIALRLGEKALSAQLSGPNKPMTTRKFIPKPIPIKPKVALCLSGQMRGYEACAKPILEHIVKRFDADVFISTWDNLGSNFMAWRHYGRLLPQRVAARIPIRHQRTQFSTSFPRLTKMIEGMSSAKITKKMLNQTYGDVKAQVLDESQFEARYFDKTVLHNIQNNQVLKNQMKMCFQIDQANKMKSEQEAKNSRKYDIVIRMRPDLLLSNDVVPALDTFGFDVYCESVGYNGCGDQLCISSSQNMDMFARVWERSLRIATKTDASEAQDFRSVLGTHQYFSESLWIQGLSPRLNPKPIGATLIAASLDFGLAAKAMLLDMQEWKTLDSLDKTCAQSILSELKQSVELQASFLECSKIAATFTSPIKEG